ncbi:MAG TPA: hypothetical protein VGA75_04595 [Paracoccaceae bacterium]
MACKATSDADATVSQSDRGPGMLLNEEKLRAHLTGDIDGAARSIYLLFAHAKLPNGMQVRAGGHGYIEKELRFQLNDRWYFSAVLNRSWVLWYFRRPALSDLGKEPEELLQLFPTAENTGSNEVKLRIQDLATELPPENRTVTEATI